MTESYRSMSDSAFVDACYEEVLGRKASATETEPYRNALRSGTPRLTMLESFLRSTEHRRNLQGLRFAPAGHFYSPLPSEQDIERHREFDWSPSALPGVELQESRQLQTLERFGQLYPSIAFPERRSEPKQRYQYDNPSFSWADAIFLHCMIRDLAPRKIIEVGSGSSTCAILDTNDQFFGGAIECIAIEPHADYLRSLLDPDATPNLRLLETRLQDVDPALFQQLAGGDILFVDSTHVAKLGSDVNHLVFAVLPLLATGVVVHFPRRLLPLRVSDRLAGAGPRLERAISSPRLSAVQRRLRDQALLQLHDRQAPAVVRTPHARLSAQPGRLPLDRTIRWLTHQLNGPTTS